MWQLLVGYAIGTAQILGLEWFRDRRAHVRGLRLLRAEFQHIAGFEAKFNWSHEHPPASDETPNPPVASSAFFNTVASIDWQLTDEHKDDNSIVAVMGVADGCELLQRYRAQVIALLDEAAPETDKDVKRKGLHNAIDAAQRYDAEVDTLQFVLHSALKDMERRISEAGFWRQVRRTFRSLPAGTNPTPITKDDPRVKAFVEERARRRVAAPH